LAFSGSLALLKSKGNLVIVIPFNFACVTGLENEFILDAIKSRDLCGNGKYTQYCQKWFEKNLPCVKSLMTPSCTHALEMAALLIDTQPGDEIIMPSYTFTSTANAFALRGAKIVFVDIKTSTMNMNENEIESAITPNTKAIVAVHYAGVSCDMDLINGIAKKHQLIVIEDAAQGICADYKGRALGTNSHIGAISFHATKNITSGGEGGLLIINDEQFAERAELIREKGTNRAEFFKGLADKYFWKDLGSNYTPSELQAAYLWGQLQQIEQITQDRINTWNNYHTAFSQADFSRTALPAIPKGRKHNAHIFYLKAKDNSSRSKLINHCKDHGVAAVSHYEPLHATRLGESVGRFNGEDRHTSVESARILRLPLWYNMQPDQINQVISSVLAAKNYLSD